MKRCPHCGGNLEALDRLGAPLSPFKARLFDIVKRSGETGVSSDELLGILELESQNTLKAHIWQINDAIDDSGWRIRSTDRRYRLAKCQQD